MNLEGIIAISGKPGIFKLLTQSKGGFIVKSLVDGKKFPVQATNSVSALQDIAMYTYEEEIPLAQVLTNIAKRENYGPTISHKESANKLKEFFAEVLPGYDEERVYGSDMKKVIQWYNVLQGAGMITEEEMNKTEEKTEE
ncbi:MAG: DUF5606 domain-containing protein [Ichthyobacteriaceae bacterium]|nr:DUF5606 domain-containing protein [Ichthyobacteriaceae bacterium]